jgi:hypothetical protein
MRRIPCGMNTDKVRSARVGAQENRASMVMAQQFSYVET